MTWSEAVRYYNNAIYGVWEGEAKQQERRRDAEFELYRFLMDQGQRPQGEAELMAIAAALPADPALHIQVGKLMLGNSDFAHALSEFRPPWKWTAHNPRRWWAPERQPFN